MAKYNRHPSLLLQLSLFLQIIILSSQPNSLEAVTLNHNNLSGSRPRCVEAERKALLQFKASLTDASGRLSSWVGEECCGWLGVRCSIRTSNVVKLDLGVDDLNHYNNSFKLSGKLSLSLIQLSHLNHLNLSSNRFNGMIPPQLGNLSNLHYLDLSWNSLWASDLNWLSSLTSLEYLNLGYVELSRASTNWFKAFNILPSLSELHLRNCNLEFSISPLSIANLTSLLVIDLSENHLVSKVPPWLFNITTLVDIKLNGCDITGPISRLPWHSLHNMEVLNLGYNSIADDIGLSFHVLFDRTNISIHRLYLSHNQFSGQLGDSLGRLTSLTSLWLDQNSISGEIPPSIGKLSYLEELQLSSNKMNGSIPVSIGDLSSLIFLDLTDNAWSGKLYQVHFNNLTKLKNLHISCSEDLVFHMLHDWIPPYSLDTINITDCKLGPTFPPWIQTQRELTHVSLSNAQISDTIPDWFWNLSTSQVNYLDLSSNKIGGVLPLSLQFKPNSYGFGSIVNLSHNHLHGPIPLWSNVQDLHLRNNSFSGPIPTEIGTIMMSLEHLDLALNFLNGTVPKSISKMEYLLTLDLSQNNLSGQIETKWDALTQLYYLDLSKNGLFGEIPTSICSSPTLFWLDLSDNCFDGRLPLSLQKCIYLDGLNLGGNKFSGDIPWWLGKGRNLGMLSLRMNKFTGDIPQELCHLPNLHAMDLSINKLSGTIPACFGSLSRLTVSVGGNDLSSHEVAMAFDVKGRRYVFGRNLFLVNIIDLSNNNLVGTIPEEIANLVELSTLNLSRNQLCGKIPAKIGRLGVLETLDLSNNHLSGPIPESMASLLCLIFLDLSFNNLSGPKPSSSQLSTFSDFVYEGNKGLGGPPLQNWCPVNEDSKKGNGHKGKDWWSKVEDDEMFWFYVSLGLGFIMGFGGSFGTLAIKKSWRIAFFNYLDGVKDWIFVIAAARIAHLKLTMERED